MQSIAAGLGIVDIVWDVTKSRRIFPRFSVGSFYPGMHIDSSTTKSTGAILNEQWPLSKNHVLLRHAEYLRTRSMLTMLKYEMPVPHTTIA